MSNSSWPTSSGCSEDDEKALCRSASLPLARSAPARRRAEAPDADSPLDGEWRGRSDGGSCNAPLDYVITIETGIVDGSASTPPRTGPVPNLKKAAPPRADARPVADPRPGQARLVLADRRRLGEGRATAAQGRLTVTMQGAPLVVTESGGCGRQRTDARAELAACQRELRCSMRMSERTLARSGSDASPSPGCALRGRRAGGRRRPAAFPARTSRVHRGRD